MARVTVRRIKLGLGSLLQADCIYAACIHIESSHITKREGGPVDTPRLRMIPAPEARQFGLARFFLPCTCTSGTTT